MKVNYECVACMFRQSKEAIEHAVSDDKERMDVSLKVLEYLNENFKADSNSNKLGTDLHHVIMDKTNNYDPYKILREQGNKVAEDLLPHVKKILEKEPAFENYVKVAVVGNIIDFGALDQSTDMLELIKSQLKEEPKINDINKLDKSLQTAETLLYLTDNGGEILFDKLLIQKIKEDYNVEITIALKESPILNDVTVKDGLDLELDKYAKLISTGASSVGVVEDYVSDELIDKLYNSDVVISKGMGNYEGLTEMTIGRDIFFLLNTKCLAISREIGVDLKSNVIINKEI